MNNFQKQFMVSQRAIARKYAQNTRRTVRRKRPSTRQSDQVLLYFRDLNLSTDINNRGPTVYKPGPGEFMF